MRSNIVRALTKLSFIDIRSAVEQGTQSLVREDFI